MFINFFLCYHHLRYILRGQVPKKEYSICENLYHGSLIMLVFFENSVFVERENPKASENIKNLKAVGWNLNCGMWNWIRDSVSFQHEYISQKSYFVSNVYFHVYFKLLTDLYINYACLFQYQSMWSSFYYVALDLFRKWWIFSRFHWLKTLLLQKFTYIYNAKKSVISYNNIRKVVSRNECSE